MPTSLLSLRFYGAYVWLSLGFCATGARRYKKNWRYHKELQLWLTKESGTGPMEKTPHYERGFYVFFDPIIWKRVTKEFVLQYDQLEVSQKTNAH